MMNMNLLGRIWRNDKLHLRDLRQNLKGRLKWVFSLILWWESQKVPLGHQDGSTVENTGDLHMCMCDVWYVMCINLYVCISACIDYLCVSICVFVYNCVICPCLCVSGYKWILIVCIYLCVSACVFIWMHSSHMCMLYVSICECMTFVCICIYIYI